MKTTQLCIVSLLLLAVGCLKAQTLCRSTVPVIVIDQKTNAPVDDLTASNFHAKFHGGEVPIREIAPSVAKRQLIFVIDRSGSLSAPTHNRFDGHLNRGMVVNQSLHEAISAIPKSDDAAFLAFAGECSQRTDFMSPELAKAKLPEILAWSPENKCSLKTPLWDNIESALYMFNNHAPGDRIIVISDGGDDMSKRNPSKLREELLAAGVSLFAVLVASQEETPEEVAGPHSLADLAETTGGTFGVAGRIPRGVDLGGYPALRTTQLISLLAHQYDLTIETTEIHKPGRWQLSVKTAERGSDTKLVYPPYLSPCAKE